MLPKICSSAEVYGNCRGGPLDGVPLAGILGDQQAALFGQTCFHAGEAKNTYGTGCFMLTNTGEERVHSTKGLLTTVAYRLGDAPPVYALEGGVPVAGALVQWLRDNMGLIASAPEVEALASSVEDNGGVYFVPGAAHSIARPVRAHQPPPVLYCPRPTATQHFPVSSRPTGAVTPAASSLGSRATPRAPT